MINSNSWVPCDPEALAAAPRRWLLVYVGNQYGRDPAFTTFFAPAARVHPHRVAGKWTRTDAWPHVDFIGRVGYPVGRELHRQGVASVLLTPERYSTVGAVGQRLFEAVLAGCLPIGPATIRGIHRNIPRALVAEDGAQVASLVGILTSASPRTRSKLLTECLRRLDPFRVTAQTTIVNALLKSP
ncbi:hypothetical protein [Embleya sp. MST-111070]|uniref:hypothetical protein n=1 Tax=Embleya sp. MST-111070 TaxID=3398231 RepID=UPI003F7389C3